jgi:hypothetical protein
MGRAVAIDTGGILCMLTTGTDVILNHTNLRTRYFIYSDCVYLSLNIPTSLLLLPACAASFKREAKAEEITFGVIF